MSSKSNTYKRLSGVYTPQLYFQIARNSGISDYDWLFHPGNTCRFESWVWRLLKDVDQLSQLLGHTFIKQGKLAAKYDVSVRWLETNLYRLIDIGVIETRRSRKRLYWIAKNFVPSNSDPTPDQNSDLASDPTSDPKSKKSSGNASKTKLSRQRKSSESSLNGVNVNNTNLEEKLASQPSSNNQLQDQDQDRNGHSHNSSIPESTRNGVKSISEVGPVYTESEMAAIVRQYQAETGSSPSPVSTLVPAHENSSTSRVITIADNGKVVPTTESSSADEKTEPKPALSLSRKQDGTRSSHTSSSKKAKLITLDNGETRWSTAISRHSLETCQKYARAEAAVNPNLYAPDRLAWKLHLTGREDTRIDGIKDGSYQPTAVVHKPHSNVPTFVGASLPSEDNEHTRQEIEQITTAINRWDDLEARRVAAFDSLSASDREILIEAKIGELKNSSNGKLYKRLTRDQLLEKASLAIQKDLVS